MKHTFADTHAFFLFRIIAPLIALVNNSAIFFDLYENCHSMITSKKH